MQISPDDFQRVQFLQALLVAVQQWTERRAAFDLAKEQLAESERDLQALGAQLAAITGAAARPVVAPSIAVAPNAPIAGAPTAVTMPIVPAQPPPPSEQKPADEVVLDWMRGNPQEVTP